MKASASLEMNLSVCLLCLWLCNANTFLTMDPHRTTRLSVSRFLPLAFYEGSPIHHNSRFPSRLLICCRHRHHHHHHHHHHQQHQHHHHHHHRHHHHHQHRKHHKQRQLEPQWPSLFKWFLISLPCLSEFSSKPL